MIIEIKHWLNGNVIHSIEADTLAKAVELLVARGADLSYADLRSANLRSANLHSANLSSANLHSANLSYADLHSADLNSADLSYADLRSANLSYADLRSANLNSADLRSANLHSADLSYADLRSADLNSANLSSADLHSADLRYANLSSANLHSANLRSADLSYADLHSVKNDLWAVLCTQPLEVAGLRVALIDGKVDGSTYEGECACLVGTIANVAHCHYQSLPHLKPDSSRPIEVFFCSIRKGDTPDTNPFSKLAVEWIDEWSTLIFGVLEPKKVVQP